MPRTVQSIKAYFASNNIILDDEWLESCIEWIREENGGSNLNVENLKTLVYEQWLLVDFTELRIPILPQNITAETKYTLNKTVCLQVQSIIDISKPKYHQIMIMRKTMTADHKNDDNKQNGKRVLQMTLTDGVQEILATEYRPVPCLSLNLTPGTKVYLNAPLTVRRGQIFLEPGKIKVLGGEVEKLLISNAAENILAKILDLPLNPNPENIEACFDDADQKIISENINVKTERNFNNPPGQYPNPNISIRNEQNTRDQMKTEMKSIMNELNDPELFANDDFEEEMSQIQQPKREPKSQPQITFEDVFEDDFEELLLQPVAERLHTLDELLTLMGEGRTGSYKMHAQFNKVEEKMSIKNDRYSIKLRLEDDSGNGVFAFDSEVVSNLIGYSPESMVSLKSQVSGNDPQVKAKLHSCLNNFMTKLVNLNNDMIVSLEEGSEVPIVKSIIFD